MSGVVLLTFRTSGTDKAAKQAREVGASLNEAGSNAGKGARKLSAFAGGLGDVADRILPINTGLGSVSSGLDGFASKLEDGKGKSGGWKTAIAGVGVAAIAAGAATAAGLYKVGAVFDDVSDTIRIGTGASGESLKGLTDVAKQVGNEVPAEFSKIGPVVADVNTRMGLTGDTLTQVSKQYLEAGRILGQDVDVQATSAAFSAFKLEGDAVSGAMDTLFQVSQATGVGMNELAKGAQQNAPALQNLGFAFEDTVALVGTLDKAGLNANQVMASMSKGLVTLAKDGEAPQDAFSRVTAELQGFVDTGDTASALDLASQVFGTRGASQFVGALQSGVLNMEDLMAATGATGDTILGLGQETMDAAESWQIIKNNALTALEPLSTAVFNLFGGAMGALATKSQELSPQISGFLSEAVGWFSTLGDTVGPLIGPVLELWSAFSPLSLIFQALQPVLPVLLNTFSMLASVLGDTLAGVLPTLLEALMPVVNLLVMNLSSTLISLMPMIIEIATSLGGVLANALVMVAPLLTMLAQFAGQVLQMVMPLVPMVLNLAMAFMPLISGLVPLIGSILPPLISLLMAVLPPIMALVQPIIDLAVGALGLLVQGITLVVDGFASAVTAIAENWGQIKKAAAEPINFVLETVWNNGLRSFWNDVVGNLGLEDLKLPKAELVEFADGGVLPGYTPGRDVHQFYSPTGGRLALSGGEAIMRPEFTRAVGGPAGVDRLNAAARRGEAFADGGVWGALGSFAGDVWENLSNAAAMAGEFLTNPAGAIQTHLIDGVLRPLIGEGGNVIQQAVGSLPIMLAEGLVDILGGATPKGTTGMGWEAMWELIQGSAPGLVMTSNFRPGAITANGGQSYHALGRALDLIPATMDTFNRVAALFPNASELIYTPAGNRQLLNGHPFAGWSAAVRAQHYDHIHLAMRDGGVIPFGGFRESGGAVRAGGAYVVGEKRPELFVPGVDGHVYPSVPPLSGTSAEDIAAALAAADVTVGPGRGERTVVRIVTIDGRVLGETVFDDAADEEARL